MFRPPGAADLLRPGLSEVIALLRVALGGGARPEQGLLIARRFYDALGGHPDGADAEAAMLRRLGRRRIAMLPIGARIRALNREILDLVKYIADPAAMTARVQQRIAAVRRFNRFYTRQIGVLRKTYLGSPYSLAEMRVLYEIANGERLTASDIGRALDLDAGYLSRVLRNFEKAGLITRKTSGRDARQSHLALTARGAKTFAPFEQRSQRASRRDARQAQAAPSRRGWSPP